MSQDKPDNLTPPATDGAAEDTVTRVTETKEETIATPHSVVTVETETQTVKRRPPSRAALAVAAVAAVAVIALLAFLLWPSPKQETKVAVETPPTAEGKHAGEEGGDEHGGDEHSQEGAIEVSEETAELVGIKTEPATKGEIEDTVATTGRVLVAPNGQAIVGAKVSGRAVRVLAEPGQQVGAGQVVVVVDSPQIAELRGQLTEARARLRLAEQNRARTARTENRAAVIQAKNRMDLAQKTFDRKKRLAEIGAAAGKEVQEAETEFKNAKAEYDFQSSIQITREQQEAVSEVEQARATVARLSQSLAAFGAGANGQGGTINVTSPIAGTVVDRHISAGETVTEDKELLTVMNLASVVIEAQVPESQAGKVRMGQRLIARIPGTPDRAFEGYVQSTGETVDPQTRTVPVRARVTNAGAALKHEMAVEVLLVTGGRKGALMIPASAIVDDEGVKVVYVKEGERYERRPITVGSVTYQWAEVLSGVEEGEQVVTAGAYQLKNMQKGGGEEGGHHDDH
jgi:cobalt-zinc-cadmium efflux system membrane fusion protein